MNIYDIPLTLFMMESVNSSSEVYAVFQSLYREKPNTALNFTVLKFLTQTMKANQLKTKC